MGIQKIKNNIAKKVKNLRIDKGISQENLAEFVNMSREHISCIERAKSMPTIETLYKLAQYFEVDIKYFF